MTLSKNAYFATVVGEEMVQGIEGDTEQELLLKAGGMHHTVIAVLAGLLIAKGVIKQDEITDCIAEIKGHLGDDQAEG